MARPQLWIVGTLVAALAIAGAFGWRLVFFVAPLWWTGEANRLAALLALRPGMTVADIGAGDGRLAVGLVPHLGPGGRVLATELSETQRTAIRARAQRANLLQVSAVRASADDTGLEAGCCDAIYTRAVAHHIDDLEAFVRRVNVALKPGARFVVIDFPPGGLPFHGADHGITAATVERACSAVGLSLLTREDDWGGGMFALLFVRPRS